MDKKDYKDLEFVKKADIETDLGPAVLLCLVKDERDILPAFFNHYRQR